LRDGLRNNKINGGSFDILAVAFEEYPASFAETRHRDTAGLVELQRLEEPCHERRPQVGLVLDEGIIDYC
jgi:hypothetical protein